MKKTIAVVDPASYSLPYDYFFIVELAKTYNIDFYCSNTIYNYDYILYLKEFPNINIIEYKISSSVVKRFFSLKNYMSLLFDLFNKRSEYIAIHFFWSILFFLEFPFLVLFRDKLIFTFHNDSPHDKSNAIYWPYKIISLISKKSIFVSEYTKNMFTTKYGDRSNYCLLQHGVLPVTIDPQIKHANIMENKIIFWGRVSYYKGVDVFLKLCDSSYEIEIIGKWDNDMLMLKADLDKCHNIEIIDRYISLSELENMLNREAIFILPYISATQSGVLYTFLAHNKVFISSDAGENGEFLKKQGLSNLLFDRDDIESLKNAINYAKTHYDEIRDILSELAKLYDWAFTMKNIKNIYEN